jgi:nucleoside-diphosphate-sugar epimerase
MRVLVTGGAGFLGSHIAEGYLRDGHEVVVVDSLFRGREEYVPKGAFFYNVDLAREPAAVEKIFERHQPHLVFHYAAINGTKYFYDIPHKVFQDNMEMTINVVNAAARFPPRLFVYASSSEIYGEPLKIPTPEDHPIILEFYAERDSYAASKAFGEFYTRYVAGRRSSYLVLRIFNTYGPRMDTSEYGQVIPEFIRKVLREEEFTIIGDGTQTRAFMHVEDHVRIVKKLLETGPYNDVYNVGSSQEVAILELARIIHEIVGRPFKPVFLPPRPYDRRRRCPDITKITKATGQTPQINLYTGLRQTIKWYMDKITRM